MAQNSYLSNAALKQVFQAIQQIETDIQGPVPKNFILQQGDKETLEKQLDALVRSGSLYKHRVKSTESNLHSPTAYVISQKGFIEKKTSTANTQVFLKN